jgi:hypothetical protein
MLRSLTWKQFAELSEYKQLEPFRELRADYRAASIVQIIANVNRSKKQKPYTLDDMRVKFGEQEQPKRQSQQEQFAIMMLLATAHNSAPTAVQGT